MAKISVFILTLNEEENIVPLLTSLKGFSDDVIIVDSFSTDKTLDICQAAGARIFQNKFVKHAPQCNWALETIEFKYDWILRLDSDELLPDKLKAELTSTVEGLPVDVTGIYLNRRQYFMNRWLRHGAMYPQQGLWQWVRGSGGY